LVLVLVLWVVLLLLLLLLLLEVVVRLAPDLEVDAGADSRCSRWRLAEWPSVVKR
jgi:hypothetical protein